MLQLVQNTIQNNARHLCAQTLLEGRLLNLDMTSPAATIALALMFLQTNDAALAASFDPPGTKFALDFARPDFIMLRVLAKNLVMWGELQPSAAWMSSQLPALIRVCRVNW